MQFANALDMGYCRECSKRVVVANTEPLDHSLWEQITGYHVFFMDENFQDHWRGYMCLECVTRLLKTPKISLLGGGGTLPEIHLEKEYFN